MPQFQYTAVNRAGKKLSGVIGAPSEEQARKQLNTFGISILDLVQTAKSPSGKEEVSDKDLSKFEFEAFDKKGKKLVGSIPANNRFKAFKRLTDEYEFEVSYIVPFGASEVEKVKAKSEDLSVLKAEYTALQKQSGKFKGEKEAAVDPAFEAKRAALLKKVDYILEQIKNLLSSFHGAIKPENEKVIQTYIDKLLRIKSSTNLDYIEHTSEELLKKVQDQELFLHKEKTNENRAKVKLETQKLMANLHSKPRSTKGIMDDISDLHKRFSSSESRLLKGISQFIQKLLPTPEEKEMKQRIKAITKQIWTYRKIWFTSPEETKADANTALSKVLEERKRLQSELKAIKAKKPVEKLAAKPGEPVPEQALLTEEITHFLGWLLFFYLGAYFISHYLLAKIAQNPLPGDFNLLQSSALQYLLISIFLWYILFSLRLEYLKTKNWANALIVPIGLVLNVTLVFNF